MQPVSWLPDWLSYPLFWIYLNQTLIAGAAALLIGYATIKAIRQQIRQAETAEETRIRRRHVANVAGLPLAFSEILVYSKSCWNTCMLFLDNWEAYESWDKRSPFGIQISGPEFPYQAFQNVQTAIETAVESDAQTLADLLGFSQVQRARFREMVAQATLETRDDVWVMSQIDVMRRARDSLELFFRASRCLKYARRRSNHIEDLPGVEATEEFLFFSPIGPEEQLREYLQKNWDGQHWHQQDLQ
jgi:hypothetical protein